MTHAAGVCVATCVMLVTAKAEYADGLELVAGQMAAFSERMAAKFAAQREQVFGLQRTCDELVAALEAELALPSPVKGAQPPTDGHAQLVQELQAQHHKHRERLQACASRFSGVTLTLPGEAGRVVYD